MRTLILITYLVMACWLLISAILRVIILLGTGSALDPLPFISAGLAVIALLAFRPLLKK